jgi:hypothetical protein
MMVCYIWKDAIDEDTFLIGYMSLEGEYCSILSLDIDQITDLFGWYIRDHAKTLKKSSPTRITLTALFDKQEGK